MKISYKDTRKTLDIDDIAFGVVFTGPCGVEPCMKVSTTPNQGSPDIFVVNLWSGRVLADEEYALVPVSIYPDAVCCLNGEEKS